MGERNATWGNRWKALGANRMLAYRGTVLVGSRAGLLAAAVAVGLAIATVAATPAASAPTRDGWGFAIADDDWDWSAPGTLPALGDGFAELRPKAFRFQMIWNAADLPWHMDRARGLIARARAQGVEQVIVTFKKSVGPDVDPDYGPQPSADGYAEHVSEVVRQLAADVDVWGPANEPNRGETWLPGIPGAQLLAGYYAELEEAVAEWDPTALITSPDFVDRSDLGTIGTYVNAYEQAGGGWGDYVAFHPYWGLHNETTQTTLDVIGLAPPGADVWITEAGAFGRSPSGIDDSPAEQNDKVWWLTETLAALPPVERVHYYHMRGNPQSGWDTGLMDADGTLRPAWHTWCAAARGLADPACQPVTPRTPAPPSEPPPDPPPSPAPPDGDPPPDPMPPQSTSRPAAIAPDASSRVDRTPPVVAIDRLPGRLSSRAFKHGVGLVVRVDEPSTVAVELLVPVGRRANGRLRYVVVARRTSVRTDDFSRLRLTPRRKRLVRSLPFVARVRVRAVDLAGNRTTAVGRLRVVRSVD